jgi:hypothetical protein
MVFRRTLESNLFGNLPKGKYDTMIFGITFVNYFGLEEIPFLSKKSILKE